MAQNRTKLCNITDLEPLQIPQNHLVISFKVISEILQTKWGPGVFCYILSLAFHDLHTLILYLPTLTSTLFFPSVTHIWGFQFIQLVSIFINFTLGVPLICSPRNIALNMGINLISGTPLFIYSTYGDL